MTRKLTNTVPLTLRTLNTYYEPQTGQKSWVAICRGSFGDLTVEVQERGSQRKSAMRNAKYKAKQILERVAK